MRVQARDLVETFLIHVSQNGKIFICFQYVYVGFCNYSFVIASRRFCSLAVKQSQFMQREIASGTPALAGGARENKNALAMTVAE
jgi:hypothetical protein